MERERLVWWDCDTSIAHNESEFNTCTAWMTAVERNSPSLPLFAHSSTRSHSRIASSSGMPLILSSTESHWLECASILQYFLLLDNNNNNNNDQKANDQTKKSGMNDFEIWITSLAGLAFQTNKRTRIRTTACDGQVEGGTCLSTRRAVLDERERDSLLTNAVSSFQWHRIDNSLFIAHHRRHVCCVKQGNGDDESWASVWQKRTRIRESKESAVGSTWAHAWDFEVAIAYLILMVHPRSIFLPPDLSFWLVYEKWVSSSLTSLNGTFKRRIGGTAKERAGLCRVGC